MEKEIIIVDDGSTDSTRKKLQAIKGAKIILHKNNQGKGAAVINGISKCNWRLHNNSRCRLGI